MGNFYVNYTLGGVGQQGVADALSGRRCIVTPAVNNTVVVFDAQSDRQDQRTITTLAKSLSAGLKCPVLAVLNHDDDVLWYQLYSSGELQDEYNSSPGYFDGSEPSAPTGGNAKKLCSLFGSGNVDQVDAVLRSSIFDGKYAFAFQRHEDLAKALGISTFSVGAGYRYFEAGELPEGLAVEDVIRTT